MFILCNFAGFWYPAPFSSFQQNHHKEFFYSQGMHGRQWYKVSMPYGGAWVWILESLKCHTVSEEWIKGVWNTTDFTPSTGDLQIQMSIVTQPVTDSIWPVLILQPCLGAFQHIVDWPGAKIYQRQFSEIYLRGNHNWSPNHFLILFNFLVLEWWKGLH